MTEEKKEKVFCKFCKYLGSHGFNEICNNPKFVKDTWYQPAGSYGWPEILNKKNNCKGFEPKPKGNGK